MVAKLFGGDYDSYRGQINQAYSDLGQPYQDSSNRDPIISQGTTSLAQSFVDKFYERTKRLPSENDVRSFVAENFTPSFGQKLIQNQINPDQINMLADEYIASKPDITRDMNKEVEDEKARILGLNKELDQLYDIGKTKASQDIEDAYGLQKRNIVNDLAGQGMLTQPTSRLTLNELEASKGKSMSQALATLAGERAKGGIDLSTTIENLLANERRASEDSRQFGLDYGLRKRATGAADEESAFNRRIAQQQIDLAKKLGQMQANASKPNLFSSALGGATGGATIGSKFGVPGALVGAGAGGLAGLLASLR
jgi:hypothetical protein